MRLLSYITRWLRFSYLSEIYYNNSMQNFFGLDADDRKLILEWLASQGIVSVCAIIALSGAVTYTPSLVTAAIQVPMELGRLNDNLEETLENNNFLLELSKENNSMLKENTAKLRTLH